jgi:hypothetical protein
MGMFERMRAIVIVSVLAGAGGGVAASILMGTPGIAQQPDTAVSIVRAQEFQLVDEKGRTRGRFAFSGDGQPYLQLRDENDVNRVWIGVAQETGMTVRDIDGKSRLVLSLDEMGNPSLVVRNRQQQARLFQP